MKGDLDILLHTFKGYNEALGELSKLARYIYDELMKRKAELDYIPLMPENFDSSMDMEVDEEKRTIGFSWEERDFRCMCGSCTPDIEYYEITFDAIIDPDKYVKEEVRKAKKRIIAKENLKKAEAAKKKKAAKERKLKQLQKLTEEFPDQAKELVKK